MANASAKRIASQNEQTIKTLRLALLLTPVISLLLRVLFRRSSFRVSFGSVLILSTYGLSFYLTQFLIQSGTPKRDSTGELKSSGNDLSQKGVTEWIFDVLYITWSCQVGSALFGDRFWLLYLVIPIYAGYKLYTSFLGPMYFNRSASAASEDGPAVESGSKRQEKLRKRQERGDPRVKAQSVRR